MRDFGFWDRKRCSEAMNPAAEERRLNILKWLKGATEGIPKDIVTSAAKGSLEVLKWVSPFSETEWPRDAYFFAAKHPDPAVWEWVYDLKFRREGQGNVSAAVKGLVAGRKMDLLKTLLKEDEWLDFGDDAFLEAVKLRDSEILKLLLKFQSVKSPAPFFCAVKSGYVELLDLCRMEPEAREKGGSESDFQGYAARRGDRELIKWGLAKGIPFSPSTFLIAITDTDRVDLKTFDWMLDQGCPLGDEEEGKNLCATAAGKGDLDLLKWLRAKGVPWDSRTVNTAVEGGNFEVLKWLAANQCPWDHNATTTAAQSGNFRILRWLMEQKFVTEFQNVAWVATRRGHFDILQWAVERGSPLHHTLMSNAMREGDLRVIQWLVERGCPWTEESLSTAAQAGAWACFRWCVERYKVRRATRYLEEGCPDGRTRKWVKENSGRDGWY
jgi:hypothetical protein